MADLELPEDLVAFLRAGKQLEYDPTTCEAGAITLLALDSLRVEIFPMDCQSTDVAENDPHRGELGCYLVEGVNLVAACTAGYEVEGLLLWLPRDGRYGAWDSSHDEIVVFAKDVRWSHIAAAPARHINAQWAGMFEDAASVSDLVPWPLHPYNAEQFHRPLLHLPEWYEAKWLRRGAFRDGVQLRFPAEVKIRVEHDGDTCEVTAQVKPPEANAAWSPTKRRVVPAQAWQQVQAALEAGFWTQPPMDDGEPVDETATTWSFSGYRPGRYHQLYRSYDETSSAGNAVHELGRRVARLAEVSLFEAND